MFPWGSRKLVRLAEAFRFKYQGTFCLCKWTWWRVVSPLHANDLGVVFVEFFCWLWLLFWGDKLPGQCECHGN